MMLKVHGWQKQIANERGLAMPAVVLVLALLTILVIGSVRTVEDEVKASRQMRESAKAFYAAEAGVEFIVAHWDSLKLDTLMPNPGDTVMSPWIDLPENKTAFRAVLQRVDDGSQPTFSVRTIGRSGVSGGAVRNVSAVVQPSGGAFLPFKWAIFGHKKTKLENTPTIIGDIATNGTLEISNNPVVIGDAQAGDSIVGSTAGVTGTVTDFSPWSDSLPPMPCPPIPWGPPPSSFKSFNAMTGHLVMQEADAVFTSGVYHFNNFTKKGTANILVPPGETVIIFVEGMLDIGGGGTINAAPSPAAALQIYGCGGSATNWVIGGGGTVVNGVFYSAKGNIRLDNDAILNGSFIGNQVIKSNNGSVTYDSSIADLQLPGSVGGGGGGVAKMLKGTWAEY